MVLYPELIAFQACWLFQQFGGKGAFKYYVIRLRGMAGLNQNDDNDGWGVWDLNDDTT